MPVTRIKARPKKKNKTLIELTEEEYGVLEEVLQTLQYMHEVYGLGIMHILKKIRKDSWDGVMKTEGKW